MQRKAVFRNVLLVAIAFAIIPPLILGEPRVVDDQHGGDPWRNFYLDFQTLIGGALAIFAAWWTVDTMETTDRQAAQRHAETMALNLRSEYVVLDRGVRPTSTI